MPPERPAPPLSTSPETLDEVPGKGKIEPVGAEPGARSEARNRAVEPKASELDFSQRVDPAALPEWMDEPCTYEEFRDCVRDIGKVNRWTLAYGPTRRFVQAAVAAHPERKQPWRVLDVGSGGGDTLRRLALWAVKRRVPVALMGMDLNPHATRAAEEFSGRDERFRDLAWRTGDAFEDPAAQDCDLVLSALVTHHMRDAEIVKFLQWMERTATTGWFINDLVRSPKAYRFFGVWSKGMRWHPFVRHDGLVSIRRSFRTEDWRRYLGEAGIPLEAVQIRSAGLGRLCVSRLR
ncbi:MAG: methyltransferase domain-containing protein [Janthinobacterium lividum]